MRDGEDAHQESEVLMQHSRGLCAALSSLLGAPTSMRGYADDWAHAALVAACVSHLPAMRTQLWRGGIARRIVELAVEAAAAEPGTALQLRTGWLYTAARCVVEAELVDARTPPRLIIQRIEAGPAASKEECLRLWERAEELTSVAQSLPKDGLAGSVTAAAAAADGGGGGAAAAGGDDDDGLSDADRQLQQQQIIRDAANIDFDSLRDASSLPTLLKLFGIAQLRNQATRSICRIALNAVAPDTRTAMQKRLQRAAAKAAVANGLWERPKTMSDILEEANRVVREAAEGGAERVTKVNQMLDPGDGQVGVSGEGKDSTASGVAPVTKSELTTLLQQHVTWGFVGGSDRFRVHVRKVIATTPQDGLQILPAVAKRGPEHAIGEHHVSVAIWGKPGDVGEPPAAAIDEHHKDTKKQMSTEGRTFNRFNSGRQLVDDVRAQSLLMLEVAWLATASVSDLR